jgi:hypothetical protein
MIKGDMGVVPFFFSHLKRLYYFNISAFVAWLAKQYHN